MLEDTLELLYSWSWPTLPLRLGNFVIEGWLILALLTPTFNFWLCDYWMCCCRVGVTCCER